jgi:hypothetical protein
MSTPIYKPNAMLLAKLESSYGVDPTPTAASNAMLVRDMSINPVEGNAIDLNYQRGFYGASKSLLATHYQTCQFSTDWMPSASLVVGTASPLDPLFRACGLSNTSFSDITGTAQSASNKVTGTAQTQANAVDMALYIKLASGTTQADDFFNGALIRITAGKGVGQERRITDWVLSTKLATVSPKWKSTPDSTSTYEILPFIKLAAGASSTNNLYSGLRIQTTSNTSRAITDYHGSTKVATVNADWTVVPTSASYTINTALNYDPVSTGQESVTIYYNLGGVRHKLVGCRGTMSLNMNANELPGITFNLTGLYGGTADVSEGTPVYTAFAEPLPITSANTSGILFGRDFSGSATNLQLQKFSLDLGNSVVHRQLVGSEAVVITDRMVKGSLSIEMTTMAVMDWMSIVKESHTGRMYLENGIEYGLTVALNMPNIQIDSLSYSDSDGVVMADMGFRAAWKSGNDDIRLIEK